MELVRVDSTMMYAVGYDEEQGTMDVVFYRRIYRYFGVPREVFEALVAAESKGKFMRANVIGQYEFERVRKPRGDGGMQN
jgi:hypothetical protein